MGSTAAASSAATSAAAAAAQAAAQAVANVQVQVEAVAAPPLVDEMDVSDLNAKSYDKFIAELQGSYDVNTANKLKDIYKEHE